MYKRIFNLALISALSTASFAATEKNSAYDSSTDARIRLFGQNQLPTIMHSNINCESNPKGTKINVGGSTGDAFKSFIRTADNTIIGMPETIASQNVSQRNGILSKAFYKEIVIKAGQPVNVRGGFIGLSTSTPSTVIYQKSASSKTVSFTPQAGHDYEVLAGLEDKKGIVLIKDIVLKDGQSQYQSVTTTDEFSCKK